MITTKEKLENEAKQRNMDVMEKQTHKRETQEHLRVAESLRQLFLDKQKRVLYLVEVIELLQERIYS